MSKYRYITMQDRKAIALWYSNGDRPCDIAARLGVHTATIYNELHRGSTGELDKNYRSAYDPEKAHQVVQAAFKRRGRKGSANAQEKARTAK